MSTNRRSAPHTPDPDPGKDVYKDGGAVDSITRLLFGETPDASEGGRFRIPPNLPISPEVDYQIASSFYRGQLQAATTDRR